ncbi:hypothetical protein EH223_00720 [candidate division KSB1 bacterium]|nr:hypothetical protein [candidate division KSB1 bacterium]RQW07174.1 MAG: hypothetical protein EH223_00720 [candidate division KSB1 bacterium]
MKTSFRLLCFCCFVFQVTSALSADHYFTILEKSTNRAVVEWIAPDVQWTNLQINSRSYTLPEMGGLPLQQNPGHPQLPIDAISFENRGQTVRVMLLDSVFERKTVGRLCPTPTLNINNEETTRDYIEDANVYQTNRFFPQSFTSYDQTVLRQRNFARVQVNPVKANTVTGEVLVLRYLKFEVVAEGVSELRPGRSFLDEKLDALTAGQLGSARPVSSVQKASGSADLRDRVKIYIVDEGVTKITGNQLKALGLNLAQLDPLNLKLFCQGDEIACHIAGGDDSQFNENDFILFYAERLAGETDFYHAYTDTNIYWLQWDVGAGRRLISMPSQEPTEFMHTFYHTAHFEQDREYYQGDSNSDIQNSLTVPGEGWVWDKAIDPGETFLTTFDVPGYVLTQPKAYLTLRVRGETFDSQPDAHHLRVLLNDKLLLDTFFDDRQELVPTIDVDGAILRADDNKLAIESVAQGTRTSRFYFDWFEVSYEKNMTATSGWLRVDSLKSGSDGLTVNGFSSSNISIWDIRNDVHIIPYSSGTSWTAEFVVESAGLNDGNYARFFVNSNSIYTGTRGIGIVAINASDGSILLKKTFDTYGSRAFSDSLALLLNGLVDGTILLAGVRDDAATNLTAPAKEALQKFGSQKIDELKYRDSWAFIGRKGAAEPIAEAHKASTQGSVRVSSTLTFASGDSTVNIQFAPPIAGGRYIIFDSTGVKSPLKLKWRQSDPLSSLTGADYLIITHAKFATEAQRLAAYRQSLNNFSSAVILVEDIYDSVNDGIADPEAIRQFLMNSTRWNPPPSYVLLFGDASWDFIGRLSGQFSNYVPSLGNPVSDVLFACYDGPNDFIPDVNIGRIPVKTVAEARSAVDKIIDYERTESARWKKNFLFISGGLDEMEQQLFRKQSAALASEFVASAPTFGSPLFINKDDAEAQADARSLILDAINAGTLWTNFIGHAASRTWELMFNNPDIDDLSNTSRYPVISSMTCHTGRFAEPNQESFGEKFLLVPNKGAISFWGTSGWGYSYEDYLYLRRLYTTVLLDSVRYLGDIITLTKFAMWQYYGDGAHIRNLILQYNLMGDPAITLSLPTQPDLTLEPNDIRVSPLVPSEADSLAQIKVNVQNWGLATRDSVVGRLDIEQLVTKQILTEPFVLPPVGRSDSLSFDWPLKNMAGPVELRVTLDPQDQIKETDETNNVQMNQVTVLTSTFAQVAPPNNALIPVDQTVLKIQTPQQFFDETARYIFEIDTVKTFTSPALRVSPPVQVHPLLIKWQPDALIPGAKYYWRVHLQGHDADDSFLGAFYTSPSINFGWRQADSVAAAYNMRQNTIWTSSGTRLEENPVSILLQSAWTNSQGYAVIEVNNRTVMQTHRGFNIAVLNPNNGDVLDSGYFDTYANAEQTREMVEFIGKIPQGRLVLAAVRDEGSAQLTEEAFQALETLGSSMIRNLGYRDMWAIIGKKGAAKGSVPEGWEPAKANGAVVLKDTLSGFFERGRLLSERIGPATHWSSVSWDVTIPDSCDFTLNILGYQKFIGDTVRLFSGIKQTPVDLSSIDASEFPFIHLDAHFQTARARHSPLLQSWGALFSPAPDITIGRQLVTQNADTVLVGQVVTFYLDVFNIGLGTAQDVTLSFDQVNQAGGVNHLATVEIDSIAVDRYVPIQYTWQVGAIPGEKQIAITADPGNLFAELSESNNAIITSVYVHADTLQPEIKITFDDREIFDGDLVDPEPLIVATLRDNNPELSLDSTRIKIYLDGSALLLTNQDVISLHQPQDTTVLGELHIQPVLDDGDHLLEIQFSDASMNSVIKRVSFVVESDLELRHVLNYPNPFATGTEFCFDLTRQALVRIKVFTVAGRLIKTIEPGLVDVGYNRIYWDGLDQDGDLLANGVYLYYIIAETADDTKTATNKVIVMR